MLTQGAVYRPDDHGGTVAAATKLSADSNSATVGGVIERNTDLDFFRMDAIGGSLSVNADPAPNGANLRLEVKLYNSGGVLLQTATSADVSGASGGTQPVTLNRTVAAGVFYVSVDGIGNGNPLTTGYSDYASIGQYNITVTGVVPGGFTWTPATAGTKQWNTSANWAAAIVPNAAGATVRINNDITGNQTIQLASATTLGSLDLGDSNSTHAFTLASSGGSMVFNNSGNAAILSKTTGGNDTISVPVSLANNLILTQSASGTLAFSGGISGAKALTKTGAGTVVFASPNSYTGVTTLEDGLLRLDDASGLPGGIDNAVGNRGKRAGLQRRCARTRHRRLHPAARHGSRAVELGSGHRRRGQRWLRRLRCGPSGQAQQRHEPRFHGFPQILGNGNSLILGHPTATHTLDFRNGISFSGEKRTVQVEDGEAAVDAILSGVLSDFTTPPGSLNKTGPGVLSLANSNTYTGTTTVADGVLAPGKLRRPAKWQPGTHRWRRARSWGVDLTNRTIGAGVDQVQWLGSGGFAAFGADRVVRFTPEPDNSASASINWNATNFIGTGRVLILGHDTADATLLWQQRISLAGNLRIIQVNDGSADIDAIMSGIIAGGSSRTSNRFNKAGAGTLAFTAQNNYWGDTIIGAGTLMIGDGGTVGGVSQNSRASSWKREPSSRRTGATPSPREPTHSRPPSPVKEASRRSAPETPCSCSPTPTSGRPPSTPARSPWEPRTSCRIPPR